MARKKGRPATHSDSATSTTIEPAAIPVATEDDPEPYYSGTFMGQPLHRCPVCPETRVSHDMMAEHVESRHIEREPPTADRAAAAGIILPGSEGGAE